jgi:hypothetical protein
LDNQLDLPVSTDLRLVVNDSFFLADIALRPGKLNEQDAEWMRRFRARLEDSLQQFLGVLSGIATQAPTEAAQIERFAAQIVWDVGKIRDLHPAPSPNVRDAVVKQENRKRGKKANAASRTSDRVIANDEAFEKVRPLNFDGEHGWIIAGQVREAMQTELAKRPGRKVKCIDQRAIYNKLMAVKIN